MQGEHAGRKFKQVDRTEQPALGLAILRRDGFVSFVAGEEEGMLLSKPLVVEGAELHLNATSQGHLLVELTDDMGQPLPGYTSLPMVKDRTDAIMRFDRPLAALRGHRIRLRFRLKRANLYSYWFAG